MSCRVARERPTRLEREAVNIAFDVNLEHDLHISPVS